MQLYRDNRERERERERGREKKDLSKILSACSLERASTLIAMASYKKLCPYTIVVYILL